MAFELRELQGNIFPNKYKQPGSNQPDRKGDFLLNGVPFEIAIWHKEGAKGPFLGFKISEKRAKAEAQPEQSTQRAMPKRPDPISSGRHPAGHDGRDMDDEIPF